MPKPFTVSGHTIAECEAILAETAANHAEFWRAHPRIQVQASRPVPAPTYKPVADASEAFHQLIVAFHPFRK